MTDRATSAVGARVLALGASVAATLSLMGGMAAATPDAGASATPPAAAPPAAAPPAAAPPAAAAPVVPPAPVSPPQQLTPTTAPPTTSSHAS